MFDVGLAEMAVIALVAVVVVGPGKLPELARQAGRMARRLRSLLREQSTELRRELGPEYADLRLADLDPRVAIRRHLLDGFDDEPGVLVDLRSTDEVDHLQPGETPPYDAEAT